MWHDNLIQVLQSRLHEQPSRPILRFHRDGAWREWSYAEVGRRVGAVAGGLDVLGVRPGDRVGVVSEARPEWLLADLGALAAGAVVVALHARLPAHEIGAALDHSDARVVFVEDRLVAARLASVRHRIPQLEQVILLEGEAPDDLGLLSLAALESLASPGRGEERVRMAAAMPAASPCAIAYDTGDELVRGAVLTHRNVMGTLRALRSAYGAALAPVETTMSCLPPAHLRERVLGWYLPLFLGKTLACGRGPERILEDLAAVRPGYLVAVPRLLELLHGRLQLEQEASPGLRRRVLSRALELGRVRGRLVRARRVVPTALARRWAVADRLVLSRLRDRLGGLSVIACGGAPLSSAVARFYDALGIVLSEGWGRSETTAVATFNPTSAARFGSAGRPLPGVEVDVAPDGELRIRGVNVFAGYHRDPEATASVIDGDGFVRTGDLGRVDADGFVHVVGRAADRIVTSDGRSVAPQWVESRLRERPLIADALVYGDRRPFLVALLTLDRVALALAHPSLADRGVDDAALRRLVEAELRLVNIGLPAGDRIRDFRILSEAFSIEAGELSFALRPRRRVIAERYRVLLESMYVREAVVSRPA